MACLYDANVEFIPKELNSLTSPDALGDYFCSSHQWRWVPKLTCSLQMQDHSRFKKRKSCLGGKKEKRYSWQWEGKIRAIGDPMPEDKGKERSGLEGGGGGGRCLRRCGRS